MLCVACNASVPHADRFCPVCGTATPVAGFNASSDTTISDDSATATVSDETQIVDSQALGARDSGSGKGWSKVVTLRTGKKAASLIEIGSVLGGRRHGRCL
jgi:hypothetical protein